MPHSTVRLRGGADQNETAVLNAASIQTTNLVRYTYSDDGITLVQKLGGWTKFLPTPAASVVRALWAWADTDAQDYLAAGGQNQTGTYQATLTVTTDGVTTDITPRSESDNITPDFSTVSGSSLVTIKDTVITNVTNYDAVYIATQVSIGGLVLFGLYACDPNGFVGVDTYTIQAVDKLGAPLAATATVNNAGAVPLFSTTLNSSSVQVTLNDHGYQVGNVFPVLTPTTVGGVTFSRHYTIQSVIDADNFTITGSSLATATTTGSLNSGNARFTYSFGVGAIPSGTGFGVGGFGRGGFGRGTAITPSTGSPISAEDWTFSNWGEILIATPDSASITLATTSASGTGTTGTLNFSTTYTIPVGTEIIVTDMAPNSWNGTYTVTASTSTSVSFATAVTAAQTQAGTITVQDAPFQPIYQWDAEGGAPTATVIPQGPPFNDGAFVAMPERQIVAWGSTFTGIQDPLLIRWCDINNFSSWIGLPTNQAGSFRLPKGSRIVGGIQGPQQALIWTDLAVWAMQYVNQPLIYGFNELGVGCGLMARKAMGIIQGVVYWMGPSQFFRLGAGGVEIVPCTVWDVVFQNLSAANVSKIRTAVNSLFNEIAWYFPSATGTGEVDTYVKYNVQLGMWDYGSLGRSAWIDQSVLGPPIGADPSSLFVYQHETSHDADGRPMLSSFSTGQWSITEGDDITFSDQIWPDMKFGYFGGMQNATVQIVFDVAEYPGDTPQAFGPYSVTQATKFISPRMRGRLMSMQVSSSDLGTFWRLGGIRYRWAPDGRF